MTVRYSRGYGVLLLVGGVFLVAFGIWLLSTGGARPYVPLLGGVLSGFLGARYLTSTYLVVGPQSVELKDAVTGRTSKTYAFTDPAASFRVDDSRLYYHQDNGWQKTPVRRFVSDRDDWQALQRWVSSG